MSTFSKKEIKEPERIGVKLRNLRERESLSIEDLAIRTKLQKDHLIAIEACAFHKLPHGEVYQKCFLKRYLSALDIDPTPYIKQFEYEELRVPERSRSNRSTSHRSTIDAVRNVPALIRTTVIAFGMLFVVGYLGFQIRQLMLPPPLVLDSPTDGIVSESTVVSVAGKTDPEVSISINGEAITSNEAGVFRANVDLQQGLNTIVVAAEKKHGKQTVITRHIIYREPITNTVDVTQLTPSE